MASPGPRGAAAAGWRSHIFSFQGIASVRLRRISQWPHRFFIRRPGRSYKA